MKKIISLLAAFGLTICLTAAAFAAGKPADCSIPVIARCEITTNYYQITLGGEDTVTLPGDIVLHGTSSRTEDSGLRVIIIPVTPDDEPDAFAWAEKTAVTLGKEPVIYYLMTCRGSASAAPAGAVRITMTTPAGYENARLHYMDGSADTSRLRAAGTNGSTAFSMCGDGYYMFLKAAGDGGHHPVSPSVTPPATGDVGIGMYAAGAAVSAMALVPLFTHMRPGRRGKAERTSRRQSPAPGEEHMR